MSLLLILMLVVEIHGEIAPNYCLGVVIGGYNYDKETLLSDITSPYQLALDRQRNVLYFSESIDEGRKEVFRASYYDFTTRIYHVIRIPGGFANAVDNENRTVYIGSRKGIHIYDFDTGNFKALNDITDNIWQLFFKEYLYYTTYPDETAHIVVKGKASVLPILENTRALLLALDNEHNIYFSNSSGLFCYYQETDNITNLGDYNVNAFSTDANGTVYFSTPEIIYKINDNTRKIEKLVQLNDVYGFAIEDNGNVIYADEMNIMRLKKTKQKCPEYHDNNDTPGIPKMYRHAHIP